MKKILLATTATVGLSALALVTGLFLVSKPETFDSRWQHAASELERVHPEIPNEKLHAKALEILRGRTVAEDEESCPIFNLTPEIYNVCKGEPK